MKKILIIGAGFLQSFVIKKAKEIGYYTIAIDKNPHAVGFEIADEFNVVDIIDQEACLKYAKEKEIDGVMTAATDYGVLSAAYIAEKLNLPGLNYNVAKVIKNKYKVRRTLFENKIDDIDQYYEISCVDELDKIYNSVQFPVMVKPIDGSGSKAAKRVDNITDLKKACKEAVDASLEGKALIEDFIEGKEYGVESFVYNGEIHVLGVMGKYMTNPPDYAELGHIIPSQLEIEKKVRDIVRNAIATLGINYGAVNMDLLITNDNRICIVDIGARMGGNLIGSHIIPIGTGVDYMEKLIKSAVGDSIEMKVSNTRRNVVTRILALNAGRIKSLPNLIEIREKCQVDIHSHLKVGNLIREYHNNLDGCGYIISVADDIKTAEARAEEAKHLVNIGVIRE
ncbi:MAG: ATP-grasp domain-containing protein [Bacillota bacterium]